jgi:soluble P-type ATPase
MLEVDVPGWRRLSLGHLVLDFNGTLACDGTLIPGVKEQLLKLSEMLEIHIVTADTFGTARTAVQEIPAGLSVLSQAGQEKAKQRYVTKLGARTVVCIGNGRNDRLMIKAAVLGLAVIGHEGACSQTLSSADVVCSHITSALQILTEPRRLAATLRR